MSDSASATTNNSTPPRVVILGGGLAGLSVAREILRERPADITIIEKGARPGGMALSLEWQGMKTDLGPHRIYSAIPEMREWFRDFLGEQLFYVRRSSRMYVQGRYIQYPPSPMQLLSAFGPIQLGRFGMSYLAARFGSKAEDSFADIMRRAFGNAMCEALVFPYIRKTWKREPEQISASVARARATMGGVGKMLKRMLFSQEKEGEETTLKRFGYVRGGIERLVEPLAREIESKGGRILCHAEVTSLDLQDGRIGRIEYRSKDGEAAIDRPDFVFSTIPINELVARSKGMSDACRNAAKGLRFLNTQLTFAKIARPSLGPDHWLYYPQAAPAIIRAYEPRNFDKSLAPEDSTMVCIERTAEPASSEWKADDSEVADQCVREMASTGILDMDELRETALHRLEYAYPLYEIGYEKKMQAITGTLAGIENLITLGRQGLFQHNNMDHTIYTGLRAARCWMHAADPVSHWYGEDISEFEQFRIVD
ncbi:MAG: FAD-dependent oxidoreductase [Candidatus Sumerlaeia bacterium]